MRGLVVDWRRACRHGRYGGERGERQNEAGSGELVSARGCHWGGSKIGRRYGNRLRGGSNKASYPTGIIILCATRVVQGRFTANRAPAIPAATPGAARRPPWPAVPRPGPSAPLLAADTAI